MASHRDLLRITSVQLVSDTAVLRNDTLIRAAGRTIRVAQAIDEIVALLLERAPTAGGVAARFSLRATGCFRPFSDPRKVSKLAPQSASYARANTMKYG